MSWIDRLGEIESKLFSNSFTATEAFFNASILFPTSSISTGFPFGGPPCAFLTITVKPSARALAWGRSPLIISSVLLARSSGGVRYSTTEPYCDPIFSPCCPRSLPIFARICLSSVLSNFCKINFTPYVTVCHCMNTIGIKSKSFGKSTPFCQSWEYRCENRCPGCYSQIATCKMQNVI